MKIFSSPSGDKKKMFIADTDFQLKWHSLVIPTDFLGGWVYKQVGYCSVKND